MSDTTPTPTPAAEATRLRGLLPSDVRQVIADRTTSARQISRALAERYHTHDGRPRLVWPSVIRQARGDNPAAVRRLLLVLGYTAEAIR